MAAPRNCAVAARAADRAANGPGHAHRSAGADGHRPQLRGSGPAGPRQPGTPQSNPEPLASGPRPAGTVALPPAVGAGTRAVAGTPRLDHRRRSGLVTAATPLAPTPADRPRPQPRVALSAAGGSSQPISRA